MNTSIQNTPLDLSLQMARLSLASMETIYRRTVMMLQGTCSLGEYHRMVDEKSNALRQSVSALMAGESHAAIVDPYLKAASANVTRLRAEQV